MPKERSEYYSDIYQMVSQGYRVNEITEALENALSRQRVSQLREEILSQNPGFKKIFEDRQAAIYKQQVESIKELINDANVQEIAVMLDLSKSTVYRIINDEKIVKTRTPKPPIIEKGSRYGLWIVGDMIEKRDNAQQLVRYYKCLCTGCNTNNHEVRQSNLLGGLSKSCRNCGYKLRGQSL